MLPPRQLMASPLLRTGLMLKYVKLQCTPTCGFHLIFLVVPQLWMGTHPSNPSKDLGTGRTLFDLIQDNKSLMSHEIADRYKDKLPFLFKVLSINKALSIQAHPNKKLAEKLHAKDPKNYPGENKQRNRQRTSMHGAIHMLTNCILKKMTTTNQR
jgi:Phosphomannose isomerase type I